MATIKLELVVGDLNQLEKDIVIKINLAEKTAHVVGDSEGRKAYLFPFIQQLVCQMKNEGKLRTADTYACTLRSFSRFRNGQDIELKNLTKEVVMAYESKLKGNGVSMNTISFYMRKLRATYNRAVDEGLVVDQQPFKHVYTGMGKTEKRAVDIETIRELKEYQPKNTSESKARDLFLFSFYTRGMAFVDMAYLKKDDIRNGFLRYRRKKTGQQISVKWEKEMQAIVDRLSPFCFGSYLLPIIKNDRSSLRNQYLGRQWKTNSELKTIGKQMHLERKLTMYVARHSWASIAKSLGYPTNLISMGLGHTSERTTQIYLKELDANIVDNANHDIITLTETISETKSE